MNQLSLAVLLLSGMVIDATAIRAQAFDMFPTKAAAQQRAKELKCSGVFVMGRDWMPCQNFEAYQKAVSKEK